MSAPIPEVRIPVENARLCDFAEMIEQRQVVDRSGWCEWPVWNGSYGPMDSRYRSCGTAVMDALLGMFRRCLRDVKSYHLDPEWQEVADSLLQARLSEKWSA